MGNLENINNVVWNTINDDFQIYNGRSSGDKICEDIERANNNILIMSPYIGGVIDVGKTYNLYSSLKQAIDNGAKVTIFSTQNLDDLKKDKNGNLANFINEYLYTQKLKLNLINENKYNTKIKEYNKMNEFINFHSKIIKIDDILYLGSVNFTTQAFNNNIETRIRIEKTSTYEEIFTNYNQYYKDLVEKYKDYFYSYAEIETKIKDLIDLSGLKQTNERLENHLKTLKKK